MLFPVDLVLADIGYEKTEETDNTQYILRLAQLIEDIDDEKFTYKLYFGEDTEDKEDEYFGRGNAKRGCREEYNPYDPSPVFDRLSVRPRVWDCFSLFSPAQFLDLCKECEPLWWLPRTGDIPRSKKHPIESCLFSTIGILKTGHSDLEMEAVA